MKKYIICLICFLALAVGINVSAAEFYEDFEKYTIGSSKVDFDVFGGIVRGDDSNKYGAISGIQTTAGVYTNSADGMVTVSVKLYQTEHAYARCLTVWDSTRKNRSLLIWMNDDKLALSYDNAAKQKILGDVLTDKWHTVSVTLNFDTQMIEQVFLNGVACLSEPMEFLNKDAYIADAGYLEFRTEKADGTLCIDDISVKEVLYPEIISAIDSASALLSEEEGTEAGTYPHSSFTMLRNRLNELRADSEKENLSNEEIEDIKASVIEAEEAFRDSIILGEEKPLYLNTFDSYAPDTDITTAHGFIAAKNVKAVSTSAGMAAKLTDASRLLYQYSKDLSGEYYITLSFMQETKGKIDLLLDASDSVGKGHGPMIYSDGVNILAKNENAQNAKTVIENYLPNQWYDLKVYLDTDSDIYTVYAKKSEDSEFEEKCTCIFPTISDGGVDYVMDKLRRVCNVQMYSAGSSVYIDNMGLYPFTEPVENRVNSVSVDCPSIVANGESFCVSATVFDKYYHPAEEEVSWIVTKGDASVDEFGNVVADSDYSGVITIKALLANGIYDTADVLYLPSAELENIKKEVKDGKLVITADYKILQYASTVVNAVVTVGSQIYDYECAISGNGISLEISLDGSVPSGEIVISFTDSEYGMQSGITHMHYGDDAMELFVNKFNSGDNTTEIIDEFVKGIGLGVNFAYNDHKEEYAEYLKSKGNIENAEKMAEYIEEANLVLGVKYATRDNIAEVMTKGDEILKKVDADKASLNLSDGKTEKLYLEIIGFDKKDLEKLGEKIVETADSLKSSSSGAPGKAPSYGGGGGGGGRGGSSSAVSISGAGFGVVPEAVVEKPVEITASFDDIKEAVWAKESIEKLVSLSVLSGYEGKVRPNADITRAEFSKMVAQLFKLSGAQENKFSDVSSDSWYAPYVSAMANAGLINGYPDGSFLPESKITREDAAVILARCIEKLAVPVYAKNEAVTFADSSLFADYSIKAVSDLQVYGIVSGKGENIFEPAANITRAETAVMLVNLYSFTENK